MHAPLFGFPSEAEKQKGRPHVRADGGGMWAALLGYARDWARAFPRLTGHFAESMPSGRENLTALFQGLAANPRCGDGLRRAQMAVSLLNLCAAHKASAPGGLHLVGGA